MVFSKGGFFLTQSIACNTIPLEGVSFYFLPANPEKAGELWVF